MNDLSANFRYIEVLVYNCAFVGLFAGIVFFSLPLRSEDKYRRKVQSEIKKIELDCRHGLSSNHVNLDRASLVNPGIMFSAMSLVMLVMSKGGYPLEFSSRPTPIIFFSLGVTTLLWATERAYLLKMIVEARNDQNEA